MKIKNLITGVTFQVTEEVANRLMKKRKSEFELVQSSTKNSKTNGGE